jgi:hypothetical protein
VNLARLVNGPIYTHLEQLTDARALFEHARFAEPRPEHGYCVDDVARGLVVVCRASPSTPTLRALARRYLDFTVASVRADGRVHNRMSVDGAWTDEADLGDWWGRALWGLGVAAASAPTPAMRARALLAFRVGATVRSPHLRAMSFAALGAGELLLAHPGEAAARTLLADLLTMVGPPGPDRDWPWPEPRLTYANGSVVEALLLASLALPSDVAAAHGLELLDFLLSRETRSGHLSVTPVGGRGPRDTSPGFDQQPIEVAAIADACARAYQLTGDLKWRGGVRMAWAWFEADNDAHTLMYDPVTGGGFDGLHRKGCNLNQGAESTLAMLSTAQHAVRLDVHA